MLLAVLTIGSITTIAVNRQVTLAGPLGTNSQNIGLSPAFIAANLGKDTGGGDITISGGALQAESGPNGTSADIVEVPQNDQISLYVVRPGDTLSNIAEMYNVSVNTIIWANDLTRGAALQSGQELIILPINGVRHTVTKGETLASISKKFGGDLREVAQFNDLSENATLAIGQVVMIPGGEVPVVRTSSSPAPVKGSSSPAYAGYYIRPISGGVRTQGLHGYNGVDLANRAGTPVMAAAAGRVIVSRASGWNGGYGNYIVIEHGNGTQTLYAHLNDNTVSVGTRVEQGVVIGHLGNTGRSTGPHLHFEIRGAKNPF